ncbi:arginase, hepatic-like isoform X1 [Ornithodoros turicata]|uniref:arginase, hepatic-like isoform X1 n=2 Tax=Ornithodoros turicata TaxID=34597 RepID=UPI0031389CDE
MRDMSQFGRRAVYLSVRCFHVGRAQHARKEIGVLGMPLAHGQRKAGVEEGPKFLRNAGVLDRLRELGHEVHDRGDVTIEGLPNVRDGKVLESSLVGTTARNVCDAVENIVSEGKICLTLGGDHSCAIGTIAGHAAATHSDVAVIWVDAHADLNTAKSTNSGSIHGMAVSFLIHEMEPFTTKPNGLEWIRPCVHKENFAYIALRDVDSYERYFIDHVGIPCYSMDDIDRYGIREVVQRAIRRVNPTGAKQLHVSFDIDAVDEQVARSTGTPVVGGLTVREALVIAEEISRTDSLKVLDMVEVNPKLGTPEEQDRTLKCAVKIIASFFGSQRRGNLPCDVDTAIVD